MVSLPDPRFVKPFQVESLRYWEILAQVMKLTGASREEAERFIKQQHCCVR